jgi:hypothetical protein
METIMENIRSASSSLAGAGGKERKSSTSDFVAGPVAHAGLEPSSGFSLTSPRVDSTSNAL